MKHSYELPIILSSRFTQEESEKFLQGEIIDFLKKNKSEVVNYENGGKVTLSFPIKKEESGFFYIIYLKIDPEAIAKSIQYFNLKKEILRYLIFKAPTIKVEQIKKVSSVTKEEKFVKVLVEKPAKVNRLKRDKTYKKPPKVPIKEIDKKLEDIFKETL